MNSLDSPLEALAFNYLTYGLSKVVNNLWTWVALLAAAISFWRIRASSEHPRGKTPDGSPQTKVQESPSTSSAALEQSISSPKTTPFCLSEREGSTKGKFTLYFGNEEESEKCGINYEGVWKGDEDEETWWNEWEMIMKMRRGDDEWYRYQDLNVIDGNVVRLWDGSRRRRHEATSPELVVGLGGDFTWR